MVRSLCLSQSAFIRLPQRHRLPFPPAPFAASQSTRFSSSSSPSDHGESADPLIRKLEDVIHHIIVRRSEPDWLPFRPGSSYWVPPRSKSRGIAKLIGKLTTGGPRLNADESMSTTTPRGWPSSSYFIRGINPAPRPVNMAADKSPDEASKSEDEEKSELSGYDESK